MSELSERARELAEEVIHETKFVDVVESAEIVRLIEQALLAERRLAKLEDAEIAEGECFDPNVWLPTCCKVNAGNAKKHIAAKLRAAAEKEVGK